MRDVNDSLRKKIESKLKRWRSLFSKDSRDAQKYWNNRLKDNFDRLKSKGYTGVLIAESLETDPKNFSKWKNNGGPFDAEKLSRLIYVDGINLNWLFSGDDRFPMFIETASDDELMNCTIKCGEFIRTFRSIKNNEDKLKIIQYLSKELFGDSDTTDIEEYDN
ncbi:hypothetical protein [Butyrivibrio sp. INlla16]|uniref:hypothetical protein n=1 Tax=Butyrivibrio sp. INlla16 TaxID=1520807 RepID=UPI00088913B9|nr:hypothetical protein [Butyrivibrio sp. INlla16]SDB69332.1 hypothetical protein SAMN02910263_04426 [Butyrivibrio sp. INlla16]